MNRPICLWMTSRSRSSLVSKIFANHGVWWGNTYAKTKGYEMYENQVIKQIQKNIIKPSNGVLPHCEELQLTEEVTKDFHEALKEHHLKDCPKGLERWSDSRKPELSISTPGRISTHIISLFEELLMVLRIA